MSSFFCASEPCPVVRIESGRVKLRTPSANWERVSRGRRSWAGHPVNRKKRTVTTDCPQPWPFAFAHIDSRALFEQH
eukprot:942018-Pleurochrysis_carterae.AAC.1